MARAVALGVVSLAAACAEAPRASGLGEASEPAAIGTDTALAPAPTTSATDIAEFVGIVHPPAPDGVDLLAGSLVLGSLAGPPRADYIVHHVRAGEQWMLWLSRRERPTRVGEDRVPTWRVVDVARVPPRLPGKRLMTFGCRVAGDPAVAAFVEREPVPELRKVHYAWRLDREDERIIPISPSGVWCSNPGAGVRTP